MNTILLDKKIEVLSEFAKEFLMENFNLELKIPLKTNGRLSRSLGIFRYSRSGKPISIELSKNLLQYYDDNVVVDVLKHECIHYALFMKDLPFSDRDYTFIETCKNLNVCLTETYEHKGKAHIYQCAKCSQEIQRRRKFNESRYRCKCGGKINYITQTLV